MQELTQEQCQEQYNKLKKIDEYAKSLGFTIYGITAEMDINGDKYLYKDYSTLNKIPDKWIKDI